MNFSKLKQGDIVIGSLPYSDFSQIIKRPLLIASNHKYNDYSYDIICIKVTKSKVKGRPYSVELTKNDLESGSLKQEGSVKVDSIFFISKKLLSTPVASVKKELMDSIKQNLKLLFSI